MTTSPIAEAVLPLKGQAVERAERYARKIVKQVRTELSAAGNMSKLGKVFNQYPTRRLKHLPTVKVEDIDWSKFDY